jgi:iron complex outermembrane recepter protein
MKNLLFTVSPLAILLVAPTVVLAQEAAPSRGVETIVVTAQKREQAVLDVPVAVTAYTGQRLEQLGLEQLGIEQFDDLEHLA